jgi:hypothetical protein
MENHRNCNESPITGEALLDPTPIFNFIIEQINIHNYATTIPVDQQTCMYLICMHGNNVSYSNYYFPMETKFNSILTYKTPYKILYPPEVDYLFLHPEDLLLGNAYVSETNPNTNTKVVNVPPIIFSISDDGLKKYYGIYRVSICQQGWKMINRHGDIVDHGGMIVPNVVYSHFSKLVDCEYLLNNFGYNTVISYSQLFKIILNDIKTHSLNPDAVNIGLLSCQSNLNQYFHKFDSLNIHQFVPKKFYKLAPASIFTSQELTNLRTLYNNNLVLSMTSLEIDPKRVTNDWNALATMTHQGCALNVLSYYNIIPENIARGQVACLTAKGTSIFTVVDDINTYLLFKRISHFGYCIKRFDIITGFSLLLQFLNNIPENYVIIFKIYSDYYIPGTQDYSHIGHTISLIKYNSNKILIDPQGRQFVTITHVNDIKNIYPSHHFIDIIFTVESNIDSMSQYLGLSFSVENFVNANGQIIGRTKKTTHGGTKNKITKKKSKPKKKRTHRK